MEPFTRLTAIAAPLDMANVDTDQLTPARFLTGRRADGLAGVLLHDLRFTPDGVEIADFVLNQPAFRAARILVSGPNFGCGSSRETAAWALRDYGFKAVIAPSFGDIFHANSLKNGLLPVALPEARCKALCAALLERPGAEMTVDLAAQTVAGPDGAVDRFEIDAFAKEALLTGQDELGMTLTYLPQIEAFEAARAAGDDSRA
jgi:3-isopropylmalate/(R)-2-methylmalate dehydratase small subunit